MPDGPRPHSSGVLNAVCQTSARGPTISRLWRPMTPSTIQSTRCSAVIGRYSSAVTPPAGWQKAARGAATINATARHEANDARAGIRVSRRVTVQPRRAPTLQPAGEDQDQQDDDDQSETAARSVAPVAAVRPGGSRAEEHQKQDDEQDRTHARG